MRLATERYADSIIRLPTTGKHIIAQYDEQAIVVYQAYKPSIGLYAARHGHFDGAPGFNLSRMTWIKPGFLWMMHRSRWGTAENQNVVLAIWFDRVGFDALLRKAVHSSYIPAIYGSQEVWKQSLEGSAVRIQWDPDYAPDDSRLPRRALQIGLRGKTARHYAHGGWIHHIEDITGYVDVQRKCLNPPFERLHVPRERVYPIYDAGVAQRLGVDPL